MRATVLILYLGDLGPVARVHRQIQFLAEEFEVVVASFQPPPEMNGVRWVPLTESTPRRRPESVLRTALRMAGRYDNAYWLDSRVRAWRNEVRGLLPVDAIIVNDLYALPLAFGIREGLPVIFDAHEHWTSESASWGWRERMSMRDAHAWIADNFVPRTSGMTTVSMGIARDYAERTRVEPELVTNAPLFHDLEPTEVSEPIRLIHFGMADPRRRLEDTIDAVRSLGDRFTLDLVLARDNAYRRRLEQIAAQDDRLRVLPGISPDRLLAFANDYDVGVFLLPAQFPNQIHVLPNKLFDYIQARLAVAIGPSPEMAEIVRHWDCGVVSSSFGATDFAQALAALTPQSVARMKANSHRAAQVLNADANRETIQSVVRRAIGSDSQTMVASA